VACGASSVFISAPAEPGEYGIELASDDSPARDYINTLRSAKLGLPYFTNTVQHETVRHRKQSTIKRDVLDRAFRRQLLELFKRSEIFEDARHWTKLPKNYLKKLDESHARIAGLTHSVRTNERFQISQLKDNLEDFTLAKVYIDRTVPLRESD